MTQQELIKLYEHLIDIASTMPMYSAGEQFYDQTAFHNWLAQASAAIESVFPADHAVRKNWDRLLSEKFSASVFHSKKLIGILGGALSILKDGRIASLIDAIRVETENDVLAQAEDLLAASYCAAAAVLAGGALETHLRHLVGKHQIRPDGQGSITTYNSAILKASKSATVRIYSTADGDMINAWGKIRNDAAHAPGNFSRDQAEIGEMIRGIRSLIARVP